MTIDEMIKKYNLCIPSEDETKLMVRNVARLKKDNAISSLKENKQEILARLKEIAEQEWKAREEYRAKVQSIEGLEEIRKAEADWAEADWEEYHARFMVAFGHEDAAVRQARMVKPTADPVELKKKYPRAVAYLLAESYAFSENYEKAAAGRKAQERILNGEDYKGAIAEMKEWGRDINIFAD